MIDFTNNTGGGISPVLKSYPIINCDYGRGLTISPDGEVSGFYSISGHFAETGIFLRNLSDTDAANFEFETAFIATDNSYAQKEFGVFCIWVDTSNGTRSLLLDTYENKLNCYYSYGGGNWETPFGDIDILDDTKYYIKLKIKDSTLTLSISSDGTTYTDYDLTLTDAISGGMVELGISQGAVNTPSNDIIFINDTKLSINNELVFQGTTF